MKIMLIVFLVVGVCNMSFSQDVKEKEIEIKYTFIPEGKSNKIIFTTLIPNDLSGIQKVRTINYSIEPENVFINNENKYAKFTFENVHQEFELIIKVQIDMYRRDFNSAKSIPIFQERGLDSFMIEEKFIEISDLTIKNKSEELSNSDTLKTVKNIFMFVKNNLIYSGFSGSEIGAAKALQLKEGDCTEFTDLFVALCRTNGLPAKVVEGYTTEFVNTPLHSWPEVYLNKYGWIRFDPTTNNAISYSQLYNKYIQLSSIRNDSVLNNHHRWIYNYLGGNVVVREDYRVVD